ncbi:Yqey-like protein-domain-containing protein [Blastocladiella britannica]|nr:Yqey-like protein-domain-containing protein [Blastocladiella britannica]
MLRSTLVAAVRRYSATAAAAASTASASAPAPTDLKAVLKVDLKAAMRAKNSLESSVIRSLISDIGYAEKSQAGAPANLVVLVAAAHKRRLESVRQFTAANRLDLVETEQKEMVVLERYLPKALSGDEIDARIGAICSELKVQDKRGLKAVLARTATEDELSALGNGRIVEAVTKYLASSPPK